MGSFQLVPELTYTAIGALVGVLISVIFQLWNSHLQRRLERNLKTYETRLEVFAGFLSAIDEASSVVGYLKRQDANVDLQSYLAARAELDEAQALADAIERQLLSEPSPSADVAAVIRTRARDEAKRLQSARNLVAIKAPQMLRLHAELEAKQQAFNLLQSELRRLYFKLRIIVIDDRLFASIKRMVERIDSRQAVELNDYDAFLGFAADEVGIRR